MRDLVDALTGRERLLRDVIARLRCLDDTIDADIESLREAAELVGCLRRLVAGRTVDEIHRAFGAPGDFGYETPVGAALAILYRSVGGAAPTTLPCGHPSGCLRTHGETGSSCGWCVAELERDLLRDQEGVRVRIDEDGILDEVSGRANLQRSGSDNQDWSLVFGDRLRLLVSSPVVAEDTAHQVPRGLVPFVKPGAAADLTEALQEVLGPDFEFDRNEIRPGRKYPMTFEVLPHRVGAGAFRGRTVYYVRIDGTPEGVQYLGPRDYGEWVFVDSVADAQLFENPLDAQAAAHDVRREDERARAHDAEIAARRRGCER